LGQSDLIGRKKKRKIKSKTRNWQLKNVERYEGSIQRNKSSNKMSKKKRGEKRRCLNSGRSL
jgi:hypothetical protein